MPSRILVALALLALCVVPAAATASPPSSVEQLPGLDRQIKIKRDGLGVPYVSARTERDGYYAVGWLHANDRLFQMDSSRRQASGTLAELLGSGALPTDVQLRNIGLRRAAQRSLDALAPESVEILEAYAAGVNAWIAANPLPSEYTALELTKAQFPAWTALDSVAVSKLLAFGLSFDLDDIANTQKLLTYQGTGAALGFDGAKLFSDDVMRSAPFEQEASILDGETSRPVRGRGGRPDWSHKHLPGDIQSAAKEAMDNAAQADILKDPGDVGSNVWVVSGKKTTTGRPMIANDPHLSLPSPSTFYEAGVDVKGPGRNLDLYGVTFPGAPAIVQGTNGRVSWGSTVNPTDVTDVYSEQLTIAGGVPVATTYQGNQEPTQLIPQTYRTNQPGNGTADDVVVVPPSASIPPVTVVVPRRNNGPIISVTGTTGLSVQYTGFSATREVDFFRLLSRADDVEEAIDAQRFFDVGAQNWMYADDNGNIGYKTSAEIPLREDLQNQTVAGLPPYFIRNGTGGNEWIVDETPDEDQALGYEILPFDELDGLVNPKRGWIANANQDPTGQTFDNDPLNELRPGGGIRYITPGHADGNRNKRISERIREALDGGGRMSFKEMQSIQADVKLNDAAVLVPFITDALAASQAGGAPPALAALGADAKVVEAVSRLGDWDFSTPTGIPEGYDASDVDGVRGTPTQAEIDASVAATIYALWRGQAVRSIVDAPLQARGLGSVLPSNDQSMSALRDLLENGGTGASGIVFFPDDAARDTLLLNAVRSALDLAKSPGFAPAFGESTELGDYRWGKLHRITFASPLGGPFSIPTGAGFTNLGPGLSGVATDGGFGVVDASSHSPRANSLNGFTFGSGPARRFVAEARRNFPNAVQVIPGGISGNPAGPFFGNQLGIWLTNDYHDIRR
jgi:penicillin amidase